MIAAHPLQWPAGWPRTKARNYGRFSKGERQYSSDGAQSWSRKRDLTVTDGVERVLAELGRMGIDRQDVVISTNVRVRLDGLPRSGERKPDDPGVAVYWQKRGRGKPMVMAIDRYTDVADNLAAIAATLEAMRAIERHGGAQILERAFTGFAALPAPGQTSARGWRDVFGFGPDERVDKLRLDGAYRAARSDAHPDRPGGDSDAFHAVQMAYEQAIQELRA